MENILGILWKKLINIYMKTKVALVTGSSNGIGKAIANRLEKNNFVVIHNDSSKADLSTSEGVNKLINDVKSF